jgi:hypothetical protein
MAPGVRASKRVRAYEGSEVQAPQLQTRSSKRLQPSARDVQNVEHPMDAHDEVPLRSYTATEEGNGAGSHDTTTLEEDSASAPHDSTGGDEDNAAGEEDTEGKF